MKEERSVAFALGFPVRSNGSARLLSKRTCGGIGDLVVRRGRRSLGAFPRSNSSALGRDGSPSLISMEIKVGDRVRVVGEAIIMYHIPGHRDEPIDMTGRTGVVTRDVSIMKDGFKTSATNPYLVLLDDFKKGSAHFAEHELEVISSDT